VTEVMDQRQLDGASALRGARSRYSPMLVAGTCCGASHRTFCLCQSQRPGLTPVRETAVRSRACCDQKGMPAPLL
jgi:hypothetical protein